MSRSTSSPWPGSVAATARSRTGRTCARKPLACTTSAPPRICWECHCCLITWRMLSPSSAARAKSSKWDICRTARMQRPVQIDFQGMKPREALRAVIAEQVAGLEDRFGRITACRMVVKAPSEHHRTGGLYEINIRLALPDGKEVDIARTPRLDQRHADVHFALNDAFKRARRQLQDQVRRLQGHVKTHRLNPSV